MNVSVERMKELLDYDPETGIFTWKVSRGGIAKGSVAGHVSARDGYVRINVDRNLNLAHRMAWAIVHGVWPERTLDHKNLSRSDNRLSNLREATLQQNNLNKGMVSYNTSGWKGVSWNANTQKWRAQIDSKGKHYHLGLFDDVREAAEAYIFAALEHHGEFARFE